MGCCYGLCQEKSHADGDSGVRSCDFHVGYSDSLYLSIRCLVGIGKI
jgi:hypothetical protein